MYSLAHHPKHHIPSYNSIHAAEPPNGEDSIEVDPTEEADHKDLKDIISCTLSKKLKDLEVRMFVCVVNSEVTVESKLSNYDYYAHCTMSFLRRHY